MDFVLEWPPAYRGSIKNWVRDAPNKTILNLQYRSELTDEDFAHLKGVGLKHLDITYCTAISDAAFANFEGLDTLLMSNCDQSTITDAAFVHLKGIKKLVMTQCNQPTITDAAFANLGSLLDLTMNDCNQEGITDAAFIELGRLEKLSMWHCTQSRITDAGIAIIKTIKHLDISWCTQLTNAAIDNLPAITHLTMTECTNPGMTHAAFGTIGPRIKKLDISGCYQLDIRETLRLVKGVEYLSVRECTQPSFNDNSFVELKRLIKLDMTDCTQDGLTPNLFKTLPRMTYLVMRHCRQDSFDESTFLNTPRIVDIDIFGCKPALYKSIAESPLRSLTGLTVGTRKQQDKAEICGYLETIVQRRGSSLKIRNLEPDMCKGETPPPPTDRYVPANDGTPRLETEEEVKELSGVTFAIPKAPIPEYEMPSTIRDAIHGDMPLGEYMIKMSGDCMIFKIGETYVGVQKSYLLDEMQEGASTFYECTGLFTGNFDFNDVYNVPYFGIRTSLGSFYVTYAQMVNVLSSAWSFWELTKAGTLKFTASRSGVIVRGPLSSSDTCQDGSSKIVHDTQAFSFKTSFKEGTADGINVGYQDEMKTLEYDESMTLEDLDEKARELFSRPDTSVRYTLRLSDKTVVITLKYGETKKEIPYDEAMTVGAIRDKAKELFSIPDVKLVYMGRILDDDAKTVKSANIQKGFTIQVLKVGGKRKTKRRRGGKKTYRRKV